MILSGHSFASWCRSAALLLLVAIMAFAPAHAQARSRLYRAGNIERLTDGARGDKRALHALRASRKATAATTTARSATIAAPVVAKKQNRADRFAASLRANAMRATSPKRAARLGRLADMIEYLFGYETMDTASLEFAVAATLQIPGWPVIGNLALQVRKWFPSREYRREAKQRGWKEPQWGIAAGPATPFAGSWGYDSVVGWYMPGISKRGFGQGIGIPNFASAGFGYVGATKPTEYARGSYVTGTAQVFSVGIFGLALDFTAYYRPAVAVTRYMKPLADKLRALVKRVGSFFTGKPVSPPLDLAPADEPAAGPTGQANRVHRAAHEVTAT